MNILGRYVGTADIYERIHDTESTSSQGIINNGEVLDIQRIQDRVTNINTVPSANPEKSLVKITKDAHDFYIIIEF